MRAFSYQAKMMGSAFKLMLWHEEEKAAQALISLAVQEIQRIEKLLSEFLPDSETSRMNQQAGQAPFHLGRESYQLLERCLSISKLTGGCFDISVKALKTIYQFKNKAFRLPDAATIAAARTKVGYQKIKLDAREQTVFFEHPELQVSFAAIGKGYASDQVKKIWKKAGVTAGFINASGDLNVFGQKGDGSPWTIGIADPNDANKVLLQLPLANAAVATSGDYEQHFVFEGKKYSHTINPQTGFPVSAIKSVTILSPSAELSDAIATAVCVKGAEAGLAFLEQLPQTHGIVIDADDRLFFSKKLQYENTMV